MSDAQPPRILLSQPDVGDLERQYLLAAFDGGWIAPAGPDLARFELGLTELTGWPAVALSSGTAALHLALLSCGVGPGDDVLLPTFTFVASANAVMYTGASPRFIDSDLRSWNMAPELLEKELVALAGRNELPRAVMTVDLYGLCADYDALVPICERYEVPLIEDAAEALGSTTTGRPAGTLGDVGIVSFNGNKIATTSGGGALLAGDDALADRVRYLATQARQPTVHYEHTEVGFNYRLSNLLAAIGSAQLQRLPQMMERRREIHRHYRNGFAQHGVELMPVPAWHRIGNDPLGGWNGWLTCVVFADGAARDAAMRRLEAQNIESRPLWKPMHLQPLFDGAPGQIDGTAESLFARGLCLPSSSALADDDVQRVIATVLAAS
ncbi:MAG: DegT/DnrJ/EryC1/StrS family aminotransferase [Actinomycetota bacterium]